MYTVLIVDDDRDFLSLMEMILQRNGYDTMLARNGSDGLNLFYQHLPNLVIVDDMMPGMSGDDVCLAIKSDDRVAHIPVIICSSSAEARDPTFAAKRGADAALAKPFQPKDVYRTLNHLLQTNFG